MYKVHTVTIEKASIGSRGARYMKYKESKEVHGLWMFSFTYLFTAHVCCTMLYFQFYLHMYAVQCYIFSFTYTCMLYNVYCTLFKSFI